MGREEKHRSEREGQVEPMEVEEAEDARPPKYPKIVFLIILNELCERFSFYGLRTVLFIFLKDFINLGENTAVSIYHAFASVAYFTPVFGAIIADGYIGLFKTIVSLSIVYWIGEVVLTVTSIKTIGNQSVIGPAIGLAIIAIGTGGIKPCVGAFGGNQFHPEKQKKQLSTYFTLFYMSINVGSLISTLLTPVLRSDVKCFDDDCFPLAFGVPAAFMAIAIVFFLIGMPKYKKDKPKDGPNIIAETFRVIFYALRNRKKGPVVNHWLDRAEDRFGTEMVNNVKAFCKVGLVFIPLPIFWTLYEQQGSRWTSQAQQLNGRVGSFTIKPDQFQAVNPILIVVLAYLFDAVVFPLFSKIGFLKKQLQRMGVGLLLAVLSFLIAAFLEWQMQEASTRLNPENQLRMLNMLPNDVIIESINGEYPQNFTKWPDMDKPLSEVKLNDDLVKSLKENDFKCKVKAKNGEFEEQIFQLKFPNQTNLNFLFWNDANVLSVQETFFSIKNQKIGASEVKVYVFDARNVYGGEIKNFRFKMTKAQTTKENFNITWIGASASERRFIVENADEDSDDEDANNNKERLIAEPAVDVQLRAGGGSVKNPDPFYVELDFGEFNIELFDEEGKLIFAQENVLLETCGRYAFIFIPEKNDTTKETNFPNFRFLKMTEIVPNGISLFWQVIQIFVMSVAEILFSVSGVTFAYSQAPKSMKSVIQAMWYLTVAFGNLIVIIVAEARITDDQVIEYIIFAGLLFVATLIFIWLAYIYKYTEEEVSEDEKKKKAAAESDQKPPQQQLQAAPVERRKSKRLPRNESDYESIDSRRQAPAPTLAARPSAPLQRVDTLPVPYQAAAAADDSDSVRSEDSNNSEVVHF